MKKLFSFFLLFSLFTATKSFASYDTTHVNFVGITIRPLSFINDIRINYERQIRPNRVWAVAASYVYHNENLEQKPVSLASSAVLYYTGASVMGFLKFVKPRNGFYFGLSLKFTYKTFNDRWMNMCGMGSEVNCYSDRMSAVNYQAMLQGSIGRKFDFSGFHADIFLGLGAGIGHWNIKHLQRKNNYYGFDYNITPFNEKFFFPIPSLSIGCLLGVKW
jgi:hypothetical protein